MTQIKKVGESIKVCIFMDYNMYLIQCCRYRLLKICVEPDNPSLLLVIQRDNLWWPYGRDCSNGGLVYQQVLQNKYLN